MKNKLLIILLVIVLLVVIGFISHNSNTEVLKVIKDGKLTAMKINDYVDTGRQYKVGQEYKVTHNFIFGKMYKREIELLE